MAFARAASVVDVRNVSCAHRRIEDLYFVNISDEVEVRVRRILANKERLVVG